EFRCAGQPKAVEEPATVELDGSLEVALTDSQLELGYIARRQIGIGSQLLHAEEQLVGGEVASPRIQGLRERSPTGLLVGVGPEQREQLVACDPSLTRTGDES